MTINATSTSVRKHVHTARISHNPIPVGIVGSGGMMPPYHTMSANANPSISQAVAVYGSMDSAIEMAEKYGIPKAFFRNTGDPEGAWKRFLKTNQLTVIAGPNHIHRPQAESAIAVPFEGNDRFLYVEKPPAATLDDAIALEQLEADNEGQIAVVAHNRLWDQLLEMRHKIAKGEIGDITNVEVEYQQDYHFGRASPGWRNAGDIAGEKGGVLEGKIGKLIDIAYHGLDTLIFTTGKNVTGVMNATASTIEPEKIVGSGGAFGTGGGDDRAVTAGTPEAENYLFDDVLISTLELGRRKVKTESGETELPVPVRLTVSQTDSGYKNTLRIRVNGTKGALEFNTDDAASLYSVDSDREAGPSGTEGRSTLVTPALEYRATLPDWLRDGLDMQTEAPFGYDTPPKHDKGWRETHRNQFQHWAKYAQLVRDGEIGVEERANLFTVPTANQAANVMRTARAIYQTAQKQETHPVILN